MRRLLIVFLVLSLVGYALTGIVPVRPGERAVVRRFGRVLADKPGPGLWIGLPWGMDRVDRVAVERVQNVTVGFQDEESDGQSMPAGQLLTGDQNLVDVQAVLYFTVQTDDDHALEQYVIHQEQVPELIARAAEAVMGEWVASRTVDVVLLNGKNTLRTELVAKTQERLTTYDLGVKVLDARVSFIAPPREVKPAFDSVARAQTGIDTLVNKAEQEAESRMRAARSDAFRIQQTAAAYATGQKILSQREAERFLVRLEQYRIGMKQNPDYLRQIWEEERGKLFTRLKDNGQLGLLDHHLGPDGLDLTFTPMKKP